MSKHRSEFENKVADLNHYARVLNQSSSEDDVVSLSIEATENLIGFTHTTYVEPTDGSLRVVDTTTDRVERGDEHEAVASEAYETKDSVVVSGDDIDVSVYSDAEVVVAVPVTVADDVVGVIETVSEDDTDGYESASLDDESEGVHLLEILASHAGTAISNIRSMDELERRKEVIQTYDALLRHDLRNKLDSIESHARRLSERYPDDDSVGSLLDSVESADHVLTKTHSLVRGTRHEPETRRVSLIEQVEEAVDDADDYENLSVEYDPDDFETAVVADGMLSSVLSNLVTNAGFHNEGDVNVRLSTDKTDDEISVIISDDGHGVSDSIKDRIFEMGFSGEDSEGAGIGLGYARRMVERYGGDIEVGDSDLGGAEFVLTLRKPVSETE
ncbi:sensor histidine kinase [Halorutilales archaeon Cl-col2-1]